MALATVVHPALAPSRRILAVSDIHGNRAFFRGLLEKLLSPSRDSSGAGRDILEKGPDSLGLLRDILELSQSYNGAREAVSYRAIYGACRAINIKEIAPSETGRAVTANDAELSELFKKIRIGSPQDVTEAVDKYMDRMSFPDKSLQYHHIAVMEMVSALYRFVSNN